MMKVGNAPASPFRKGGIGLFLDEILLKRMDWGKTSVTGKQL